nr:hypothetical protein [Tanacetum cinerariifolium]
MVWRNKPDLDTMSFDDLYNNFKIVEQEVKGTTSSSLSSQNMAFVSSPSSTNKVNTAYGVSTIHTQVSPARTQVSTANNSRRTVNVEETTSKAMVAINGAGFDWSYMAVDEVPTNIALMDFLDSEPEFEGYIPKTSNSVSEDISNEVKKSLNAPLVNELVSDDKLDKKIVFPTVAKIEFVRPKQPEKQLGNQLKYKEIDGGYVTFGRDPKEVKSPVKILNVLFCLLNLSYLMKVPRKNNMYSVDLKNVASSGGLTYLFAKATLDESNLWHRMLRHINFKTMNKLVKENPVRGLTSKRFKNDHTCVACQKGKQHKASCKTKYVSSISQPLQMFHMDLFGPTFVKSIMKKMYRLVVTDDYSRFIWVFFLATKDETSGILKAFIIGIENLIDHKVKIIRCDNETEFKNKEMNQFYEEKWIRREFSVDRTSQQNRVAERKNRTRLLELYPLGKFDRKADEGFFVRYSRNSKAFKDAKDLGNEDNEEPRVSQQKDLNVNSTNNINTVSLTANAAGIKDNVVDKDIVYGCTDDLNMPNLEEIFYSDDDEDVGAEANMTNLDTNILVSPILTTRIYKDHPVKQIIRDLHSAPQTRRMTNNVTNYDMFSSVQQRINHKDFQNCLFACFLSQVESKKTLLDLPYDKRAIGTKWIYKNKKDERVYQMDVKSEFMYGRIKEKVYICQPLGFEDLEFPDRVYKVEKALYGLHQAPRAWYETLSTHLLDNRFHRGQIDKTLFIKRVKGDILLVQVYVDDIIFGFTRKEMCTEFEKMMHKKFQMSSMGELTFFLGLQVTQKDDGIFMSQDKYVDEILKNFGFSTVKTTSTPMETLKPLLKDENAEDVDVHLYRSMISSLMHLTSSRPDIMFAKTNDDESDDLDNAKMDDDGSGYDEKKIFAIYIVVEARFRGRTFWQTGEVEPRYVGPFKVLERVGDVAYKRDLPEELSRVHNTFHVFDLKKCHADEPLAVPLDGLHLDDKLHFVAEPVEILNREVKQLKQSRIPLVKVRWNSKRGLEFT